MRYMRARRYRKKYRKLLIGIQVLVLWYILILSGMQLGSFTNAAFNDVETIEFTLRAQWDVEEEDSENGWASLKFISIKADCSQITAILKNGDDSKAMPEEREYKVWFAKTGNDLKNDNGQLVGGGTFRLGTGEQIELKHSATEEGTYRFIAYQEDGKPGGLITQIDIELEWKKCKEIKGENEGSLAKNNKTNEGLTEDSLGTNDTNETNETIKEETDKEMSQKIIDQTNDVSKEATNEVNDEP